MNKFTKKFICGLVLWAVIILLLPHISQAFDIKKGIVGNLDCAESGNCGFCDWIDLFIILQKVILSLFGGLALIFMVWAGQSLITAGGNEEKIRAAKKLMGSTILGIVIVLAGYFLVNVLIGLLLTPAGTTTGLTTALNGSAWARAYCGVPSDSNFCKSRGDGTACIIQGVSGYCSGSVCVTGCKYKLGNNGYACRNISSCNQLPVGTTEEKLAACTGSVADQGLTQCVRQLCPGGNEEVCCTTTAL